MTDDTALTLAKNILDEASWGLEPVTGWTPPPREDSAFYTPLCAHRDDIAYENDMALVADLRRAADEIQAARHATYPHLVTPLKKRRTPKKTAAKP